MLYTSSLFLLFFGVVWGICKLLRPWPAIKEWFLIGFSLFVILSWGEFDLALFLAVLFVNFWAAITMDKVRPALARRILVSFICLDVGTLAVFKYSNFILGNVHAVSGLSLPTFPLGIPLAISFYIFHLISYLVDVHAKRVKVATVREYLFYLSFFPHVIAGPIVRAWQLVPQIGKQRKIRDDFMIGFHFLVVGYFLKMVVANNIAATIDVYWGVADALTPPECWMVAFLYYAEIYGDFAGYSLMALGMARLLGYRLPANFRSPMRALSMQEFWQRWHITLSRWLRDYLYIPMGGNRVSPWRSCQNVLVTMLLGGLWHGAGWGFIFWGGMHGTGIVVERLFGFQRHGNRLLARLTWGIVIQIWVIAAWVFFRAPTLDSAFTFLGRMIDVTRWDQLAVRPEIGFSLLFALPVIAHNLFPLLLRPIGRRCLGYVLGASTAVLLVLNFTVSSPSAVFIYFRF